MSSLKYRPDIDGLRAIAVLLVLIYHADLWNVDGGYIGVDVFFVISGYLITSLILDDLKRGTFSLMDFWERRVRRILPALGVVTLFTLIAGWFLFLPEHYAALGKQAVSQTIFSSNIFFYTVSGYFTNENATKPLLHTWSLAVEEQYYFITPFLLAFLFTKFRPGMQAGLAALAVLSFAASVWAVRSNPDAAFYLLPFRAWELLAGSLLAFHRGGGGMLQRGWTAEILAAAGLGAILLAAAIYTPATPFPGAAALAPCLGAAMIIHAHEGGRLTWAGRLLSSRLFVAIGLISYSLYLWHWPLLMFAEYIPLLELRSVHRIGLLLLSFACAYLSWKYIEQPCRRKSAGTGRKAVYGAAFAGLVAVAALGLFIVREVGMPGRWSPQALQYAQGAQDRNPYSGQCTNKTLEDIRSDGLCQSNPAGGEIDFIVWGDSFADSSMPLFYELSKKYGKNGYLASFHSRPPIIGALQRNKENSRSCYDVNEEIVAMIKREKIKNVFLVVNWAGWLKNNSIYFDEMGWYGPYKETYPNIVGAGIQNTLDTLTRASAHPYIVVSAPLLDFNAPLALAFEEQFRTMPPKAVTPYKDYLKERAKGLDALVARNEKEDVTVIDLAPLFCNEEECTAKRGGHSMYVDRTHLSTYGILSARSLFEPHFKTMD